MQVFLRKFWSGVDAAIALVLIVMIAMVFANVVLRYGFSSGIREAIELSRLGLVWLVMVGAAVVLRRSEHLAVHEIILLLPKPITLFLRRLAYCVILVSVLMLFWGTWKQTAANWQNISPLTGLPSGLFYLAGVVSSFMMSAIAIVRIINPDARLDGGIDDDLARQEFDA
ncbi:TRAP transporter small permease [Hoeflea prorocentri]|uniref:TRAP transporter small permease protein n=1 Tax=Hoeflea prorocentri TaxID=1922333 RepID=A0A9X3UN31_9HYPH|nr:TRAP transporter small permease [Hoeflea prorocentri]MCY6383737.1 TRAP transporter small permease [Hoeflea prorocentri]MDA5401537.1 TRAP transporter small permease [Hoeflea prorocentri]